MIGDASGQVRPDFGGSFPNILVEEPRRRGVPLHTTVELGGRDQGSHLISRCPTPESRDQANERRRSGTRGHVVSSTRWQYSPKDESGHRPDEHDESVLSTEAIGGVNEVVNL